MNNQNQVRTEILVSIITIGFIIALFSKYVQGAYLHMDFPFNTFLFAPDDRFRDFYGPYIQAQNLEAYINKPGLVISQYFPFLYLLLYPFTFLEMHTASYLFSAIFYTLAIAISWLYISKLTHIKTFASKATTTAVFTLMNYGMLFCFDRGNVEIIVYLLLCIAFLFFLKNNIKIFSLFIILATMVKPYIGLYSIILIDLKDKKTIISYFKFLFMLVIVFFSMMLIFNGKFIDNNSTLYNNLVLVKNMYDAKIMLFYSVSILEPIKYFISEQSSELTTKIHMFITIPTFIISCLLVTLIPKMVWHKVTIITCMLVCLTPVAFDYKLLMFMVPIFLFITSDEIESSRISYLYSIFFGLIIIPKDYYYFPELNATSIQVLLNPILIYILILFLWYEMVKKLKFTSKI